MFKAFAAFGALGIIAFMCLFMVAPLCLSIYGLYMAFSASVVLGFLAMVVEPAPFILGVLALFGHPETAHKIAVWIGLA